MDHVLTRLTPLGWGLLYFVVTSAICTFLMAWDKFCAVHNRWRVPEGNLLIWAFLGGALGGKLAQYLFRHKTRKEPFRSWLNTWVAWNIVIYMVALVPPFRDFGLKGLSFLLFFLQN